MTGNRPRARMRLGERLVGTSTQWMTPVGVTVYDERPRFEDSTSSWEEWELRGHDDQEHWIEYEIGRAHV